MNSASLLDKLRLNILFETLGDDEFELLKVRLLEKRYAANEVILADGTDGEELFLIAEGRVRIAKQTKTGEEKLLAFLHPGDFFGELELVDGRPRSATVQAVDDCVVYTLRKPDFLSLVYENHPFAIRLMQVLSLRLRATNNQYVGELERYAQWTKNELQKLSRLIEATKVVNSTLDLNKLLKVILDTALEIVDGDRGTLYLVDAEKQELFSRIVTENITIRLPIGKGIAGYVAATGETINIPDAYADPRFNPKVDKRTGFRTKTILCMPLRNKSGKTIGVLQLLNKRHGVFSQDDESFIQALSIHAAIALENARLYESERAFHQMREEVRLAARIQLDLLPKLTPSIEGYDIAGKSVPAQMVGGDYYDFFPMNERQWAICLGDVSGKGLPASLLMANLQATLRGQAFATTSASECISRSNRLLYQSTGSEKFVTAFFCILDSISHEIKFANAGHDNPFLISANGTCRRLRTGGTVLGIMETFGFEEEVISLERGDIVVIFSDGVVEAINAKGDQFGEERLESAIRRFIHCPASQMIDGVLSMVAEHVGVQPQFDDMTMVVMKRLP